MFQNTDSDAGRLKGWLSRTFVGQLAALALLLAGWGPITHAEKVFFRDELNGAELWRLTSRDSFHVYGNAYRPFSADGQYACALMERRRAYALDLFDGKITFAGSEENQAGYPFFILGRGRPGVVYLVKRDDIQDVHRCWLDTGEDTVVGHVPPNVHTLHNAGEGLMGPRSEYVPLCGDLNGDGLADFGLLPVWEKGPIKIVLTSQTAGFYGKTVCPGPKRNMVGLTKVNCHPDIIRRANSGEVLPWAKCVSDARLESFIVEVDFKTCKAVNLYPARRKRFLTHESFSGDDRMMTVNNVAWMIGAEYEGLPIPIGDANWREFGGNHSGTCGLDGRYTVFDSGFDGMERLILLDLWTGEPHTAAHVSTPTRPVRKIRQDHGHPGGSPDGTKAIVHSCYDLVNHRLYAVPTEDVSPGTTAIPVETTEGFAPSGRLFVRHGYRANDLIITYARKDATRFLGCTWGDNPAPELKKAISKDVIEKGSHVITDLDGRLFPDDRLRPLKEYIAVVRNPAPPRGLNTIRNGAVAELHWLPPERCLETAGYAVYRQSEGKAPMRLNKGLVTSCGFVDARLPTGTAVSYWVRAVERSGLYGDWSAPAEIDTGTAKTNVLDAYDIPGTIYLEPGKRPERDRRAVTFHVPVPGKYVLWARCQAPFGEEVLEVSLDGKPAGTASVDQPEWHWVRITTPALTVGSHDLVLSRSITYDTPLTNLVTNGGFERGTDGWNVPAQVTSLDATNPHSGTNCLKMSGDLTKKELTQRVKLQAKPGHYYRLSFWVRAVFTKAGSASRFYNDHPNTPGAFWLDAQPLTDPYDRVIYGDRFNAEEWRQIVGEVHVRPGSKVTSVQLRPFLSHWNWGKQEGTVWIDDVEFSELGPRLRPVKATKLLVTNVNGYVPEGKEGRGAYPFPTLPVVPVTGLHQTAVSHSTIGLRWNTCRPGTRGCNIYVNQGTECPATKYVRKTTVWGRNTATVTGLNYGRAYTVKVAALNEDGIEGQPAALRVKTATFTPEVHAADATDIPAALPLCLKTEAGTNYLVTPKDPKDRLAHSDLHAEGLPTGSCKFEFTVVREGDYLIWGRLFAIDGGTNSFYISLDGGDEIQWSVPGYAFGNWSWLMPVAGKRWHLTPGKHTIIMRTRESGTRLARLVVTDDLRNTPPQ
ncbi:MAG: hypothetical protein HN742_32645 [Lentisphaerae bacterium]|jgi:hypothetical protein|nr:hypothetical protein [Lentisphaerota bacterium]MBT4822749.1 hypothetical protein [Lentisphaerota bacterium]MBT5605832.1 hypothetical protein [Lentisphaerota bacterium]MBT7061305.1 hypothetical protein [Lentisphaerota bacterium]MBT7846665.1 hypothetical protein [Lentisphaerota bacterium]